MALLPVLRRGVSSSVAVAGLARGVARVLLGGSRRRPDRGGYSGNVCGLASDQAPTCIALGWYCLNQTLRHTLTITHHHATDGVRIVARDRSHRISPDD